MPGAFASLNTVSTTYTPGVTKIHIIDVLQSSWDRSFMYFLLFCILKAGEQCGLMLLHDNAYFCSFVHMIIDGEIGGKWYKNSG